MKYKPGDKFIIEIEDIYQAANDDSNLIDPIPFELARIKGFNSLVFDEKGLNKLKRYEEPKKEDIQKGDEVCFENDSSVKFVATYISDKNVQGVSDGGKIYSADKMRLTKTGKHFDILAF